MTAKKPSGVENFDKSYGLGYKVNHSEFSPYPRINKLRKTFLEREFRVDIQRAELVTESYKKHPDESVKMKCALALKNVLENVRIDLYDDELIVGEIAAPAKAAPVYPEFSSEWIRDELLNHPFNEREHDSFEINDSDKDRLLEILEYWKGRSLDDDVNAKADAAMQRGSELGKRVFMTNLYHFGGIGHYVMDYAKLLRTGFGGLKNEALKALEALDENDERADFYKAVIMELESSSLYIRRYAELAYKRAELEENPVRKTELFQIAENCSQIAENPAQTMWQALQLWHFATTITEIESNGHSISYGRMDQWLYPYYEADLKEGRINKEFAEELIECAYIKTGNPSKLKDMGTVKVRNGRGWGGESLTIGGVDSEGKDATNDLTFMMLEASAHTRMMNPWVCVRVHEKTPYELKVKAVECIRAGYGHPKLYNDATAIRMLLNKGMTIEEARDYDIVGCVEPDLPGREYGFHDAAYMNLMKVFELSINSGKCINCSESCPLWSKCAENGGRLGPDTGSLAEASSIDEVVKSFHVQMDYWIDCMCSMINEIDLSHRKIKPTPYASAFFEGCLESGHDLSEGGAKYNFTGPQGSGIASCADSLSAIKYIVFDEKKYSGAQLLDALEKNWEGYEILYTLINSSKVPHFGNDDDRADLFYKETFEHYCSSVKKHSNPRGGSFCPGVYTVNANVGMGLNLEASLDGRTKGEPISDNMGPVHTKAGSHDISGPTAIANSVNKADHTLANNGTLLNWKFPPECVSGLAGRENLIHFIDAYFKGGAAHCQFNIMSSETMKRAMEKPEEYSDMLVRVAGYSAYFVELSKPLQLDLISRTELAFA